MGTWAWARLGRSTLGSSQRPHVGLRALPPSPSPCCPSKGKAKPHDPPLGGSSGGRSGHLRPDEGSGAGNLGAGPGSLLCGHFLHLGDHSGHKGALESERHRAQRSTTKPAPARRTPTRVPRKAALAAHSPLPGASVDLCLEEDETPSEEFGGSPGGPPAQRKAGAKPVSGRKAFPRATLPLPSGRRPTARPPSSAEAGAGAARPPPPAHPPAPISPSRPSSYHQGRGPRQVAADRREVKGGDSRHEALGAGGGG